MGGSAKGRCRQGGGSLGLGSRAAPKSRERDDMDGKASAQSAATTARRWGIDLAILVAIGLLMGFLGPFAAKLVHQWAAQQTGRSGR